MIKGEVTLSAVYPERLTEVPVRTIKQSIKAMKLLLRHYKKPGGIDRVKKDCPLCSAVDNHCKICPWFVITGMDCGSGASDYSGTVTHLRKTKASYRWNSSRIDDLTEWIGWYKVYLGRRTRNKK